MLFVLFCWMLSGRYGLDAPPGAASIQLQCSAKVCPVGDGLFRVRRTPWKGIHCCGKPSRSPGTAAEPSMALKTGHPPPKAAERCKGPLAV